jgi:acetoin utilization deacetylase AcuC-like enzyme
LYPGTGHPDETGVGNILNLPLPPNSGSAAFCAVVEEILLPRLEQFAPELILVSAGFDAHAGDPLANLNLLEQDYAWVTEQLCAVAARHAGGRLVSTLEGGYDLRALAASAGAHVRVLMSH